MGALPTVSVVIPCRNDTKVLTRQLGALLDQTMPPAEIVVADNGSTEDLRAAVAALGSSVVRVVDAGARPGGSYARNVGARAAGGDALLFLDADDVAAPTYVEHMAAALGSDDFVAARLECTTLNSELARCRRRPAQTAGLGTGWRPYAYGCSIGVSRRLFESIAGFDESMVGAGEDIDFCFRAAYAGAGLVFVPQAELSYQLREERLAVWRQATAYGRGGVAVLVRHRNQGMPRPSLRSWIPVARNLVSRNRCRRARGFYLLGVRVGAIVGSVEHRTWAP